MRFCQYVQKKPSHESSEQRVLGPLTAEEITRSENYWLTLAQSSLMKKMKDGELKSLTPFLDSNGIIRVGGRIDSTLVSYNQAHPALLPYGHWISVLVTREAHQFGHSGVAATTAKVRRRYWVIKGHNIAKTVKDHCTFCKEIKGKLPPSLWPTYLLNECNPILHHFSIRPAIISAQ